MTHWCFVHNTGGYTMGFIQPYSKEDLWIIVTVTEPFDGASKACKQYYIKGKKFQTPNRDSIQIHGRSFLCSPETHPEYFI